MAFPIRFRRRPLAAVLAIAGVPAALSLGPALPAPARAAWEWPVAPPAAVLRPFEAPPTRYAAGHRGIDLAAAAGAEVLATADGVVFFAGVVVDRPVLSIRHDGGLVSSIEPVAPAVVAGDPVRAGQAVGVVASGGHCDGRCVHVGVRLHGEYLNPLVLLARVERAILLPVGR